MESAFTELYYIPEGNETVIEPFLVRCSHEDAYGLEVTLAVTYTGTAGASDFLYRQTSVTMGEDGEPIAIRVKDDPVMKPASRSSRTSEAPITSTACTP